MFFFLSFISFYCYFPPNFSYFAFIVHIYTYVTSSCLDLVASSLFFLVFKNSLYSYSMFYKMFLLFVGAFSTHFLSFSLILCIVYRRFESPFYRQPPMVISPLFFFFWPPPPPPSSHLWQHLFDSIVQMINGINTKINPWGKVILSCLKDCKLVSHFFLYKQHL